jgi:flagellar motor switch protein FliN
LAGRLASVFETMAGERPAIEHAPSSDAPAGGLTWYQPFAGAPGAVWLHAMDQDFAAVGGCILLAAGLDDADPESVKSTYIETVGQALAGLAQAVSGKLNAEVTPQQGRERDVAEAAAAAPWSQMTIRLPRQAALLHVGFEAPLIERITEGEKREAAIETPEHIDLPAAAGSVTSRTFDLLLDVELPVSVSFGRAKVQLKDVLKLTTGSIIELNRSIAEPVEVIVNNCVIARGEVVVVEGNFGVRIQHVISRQERLRTLH